jgi:dTDP-4-amino-4,6-dideoxygalactose transaminase
MLKEIWDSRVLTNNGPFHQRFEAELQSFLGVSQVSVVTNGMLALALALEAADLEGEVITTPYSFVATTHAVKMGRLKPVFVDIRPSDLNIDADQIEAAITPRTSAIVAVHVYGNPCAVEMIEDIAQRHGLKVIYDAAHAFGSRFRSRSVLSWGDFATLSFHATKAFNTFEGGAVVMQAGQNRRAVDDLRNFGIASEVDIPALGTNAKMSEFNAALGLLQLEHFGTVVEKRAAVDQRYRSWLADLPGIDPLSIPEEVEPNFSYFPVLVTDAFPIGRDELYQRLLESGIYSRRYFYPLLSSLPMYRDEPSAAAGRLPVARKAADQILCLPIYPDLTQADQARIVEAIRLAARSATEVRGLRMRQA